MISILCYGDSNTFGYCHTEENKQYSEEKRWTNILSVMLGGNYQIISEGQNGRTALSDWPPPWNIPGEERNGLRALPEILKKHGSQELLIFMLGTNDCSYLFDFSPEDITANVEKVALAAEKIEAENFGSKPKIMIVSPPEILPETENTPFESQIDRSSAEKSKALSSLYKDMAVKNGWLFVKGNAEVSPLDCEHLTEKGHRELAEKIFSAIKAEKI